LVYLAVATAGITLAKSVVDLITAIIKARSEGTNRGDRCPPLELIVRRVKTDGLFIEEKVLQIGHHETIDSKQIEEKILKAASKLVGGSKKSKQLTRRSSGRGPKSSPRR
jgi:hypothetical protein